MIRAAALGALAGVLVSGCAVTDRVGGDRAIASNRVTFEGIRFRARVDRLSEDRREFAVIVRGASRSVVGAQQAGEFEANKYCIGVSGGSDIAWSVDPYQDPETVTLGDDDTLTIAGRCLKR